MNPWPFLLGVLGYNYVRGRKGLSTLCSFGRKHVKPWQFCALWGLLTAWLIPHFCQTKWGRRIDRLLGV